MAFLAQKGGNELGTPFRIAAVKNISSNVHKKYAENHLYIGNMWDLPVQLLPSDHDSVLITCDTDFGI